MSLTSISVKALVDITNLLTYLARVGVLSTQGWLLDKLSSVAMRDTDDGAR